MSIHYTLKTNSNNLLADNSGSRHNPRRMQYPSRGMGRAVPRRNLTFGANVPPGGIFPISRDASGNMDPIAELLSQLTGARRSTIGNRLNATWQVRVSAWAEVIPAVFTWKGYGTFCDSRSIYVGLKLMRIMMRMKQRVQLI